MDNSKLNKESDRNTGDMPVDDFRLYGHKLVDWIADYLNDIEKYPVLSKVSPGEIKNNLPASAPQNGESMEDILNDFNKYILPGITHWNHPNFMAYFNSTSSAPGILGEFLSAALNVNGMLWKTSPAATELEQVTLTWFKKMLGVPEEFWGIIYDTASVSTMHAVAAAREQLSRFGLRQKGLAGRSDVPPLRLYASEQAHSSVDKAAIAMGIGIDGIRKIAVDREFKMIPSELEKAITEDIKKGFLPFCAVATIGTTSTTSIDPIPEIAGICRRYNLWLHVDAAHGGIAAAVPEMRYIFEGIDQADSIVINPHKWMFTPVDLSVFFTKKPEVLKRAFSLVPEYLKTSVDQVVENYMDYGVQLGRRFRSLKLWFILRYFGTDGIASRIKEHLRLGKLFAEWIDMNPNFEKMAPVPFSTICFRANPANIKTEKELDRLNENLMNAVNATGKIFITQTKLHNKFVLRLVISGLRTEEKHLTIAEKVIEETLSELLKS